MPPAIGCVSVHGSCGSLGCFSVSTGEGRALPRSGITFECRRKQRGAGGHERKFGGSYFKYRPSFTDTMAR